MNIELLELNKKIIKCNKCSRLVKFRNKISKYINKCKIKMNKIASELKNLFPKADKIDWGLYDMPTKEGHYFPITFDFKNSCLVSDNIISFFSSSYFLSDTFGLLLS